MNTHTKFTKKDRKIFRTMFSAYYERYGMSGAARKIGAFIEKPISMNTVKRWAVKDGFICE